MSETFNGWTNYATWCVNLEVFDGVIISEWFHPKNGRPDEREIAEHLENYVHELIEDETSVNVTGTSHALRFARAFLLDVNWREIAQRMLDDVEWDEDENKESEDEEA